MANTPLVTCRAVHSETAYYHYYFFVSLLLFFYFYYFDFLSRFRVVPGGFRLVPARFRAVPGGFRLGSGRFRQVPAGSGRFRVGSAFYIHPGIKG